MAIIHYGGVFYEKLISLNNGLVFTDNLRSLKHWNQNKINSSSFCQLWRYLQGS